MSSAASVRLEVALQRRRVAVCFTEDTDVDVECGGRTRTHRLRQGVYDGRVMEVRPGLLQAVDRVLACCLARRVHGLWKEAVFLVCRQGSAVGHACSHEPDLHF